MLAGYCCNTSWWNWVSVYSEHPPPPWIVHTLGAGYLYGCPTFELCDWLNIAMIWEECGPCEAESVLSSNALNGQELSVARWNKKIHNFHLIYIHPLTVCICYLRASAVQNREVSPSQMLQMCIRVSSSGEGGGSFLPPPKHPASPQKERERERNKREKKGKGERER